jgi:hypothetical protein
LFGLWFVFFGFLFKCSSCSWCLICLFFRKFYVLCFFSLIYFWFNCLFYFWLGSNHGFWFDSGLNKCFQVNPIGFVLGQVLRFCLVNYFLCWEIFGVSGCLANTPLDLFDNVALNKNSFFAKQTPNKFKKIQKKIQGPI